MTRKDLKALYGDLSEKHIRSLLRKAGVTHRRALDHSEYVLFRSIAGDPYTYASDQLKMKALKKGA